MFQPSEPDTAPVMPLLMGMVICGVLMFGVAFLSIKPEREKREVYELQDLSTPPARPPMPEPPQPEPNKPKPEPIFDLELIQENPIIQLQPADVQLKFYKPSTQLASADIFMPDLEKAIAEIRSILDADELDSAPSILPPLPEFQFPPDLIRRGIMKGQVVVVIIIDEDGNAKVESIESSTHPKLRRLAYKIVDGVRFTPPRYQGELVKARYRWPLNLGAPS